MSNTGDGLKVPYQIWLKPKDENKRTEDLTLADLEWESDEGSLDYYGVYLHVDILMDVIRCKVQTDDWSADCLADHLQDYFADCREFMCNDKGEIVIE